MKQGIAAGPVFRRLKIPTVGLPFHRKVVAAFQRPRIELVEPYEVQLLTGETVVIPAGFVSDGGSIPLYLLWVIALGASLVGGIPLVVGMALLLVGIVLNPFGLMLVAFLVHDYATLYRRLPLKGGGFIAVESVWEANRLMRQVNFMVNDMVLLGLIAHAGVSIGGWVAWRKNGNREL